VSGFGKSYNAFDRFQQRHRWLGFPLSVLQKYADDKGGYLAATITYYDFFAIFPLLLVLTTVLGLVLRGHRDLYQSIVDSALGQFPVIGPELSSGSLHGSTLALGLGIAAALWAGMGVFLASQNAMNHLWGGSVQAPARPPAFAPSRAPPSAPARRRRACDHDPRRPRDGRGRVRDRPEGRLGRALDGAQHRPLLGRLPGDGPHAR
jgi:hypothetical protein